MSGQMKVKSLSLNRRTETPPDKEEATKPLIAEEDKAHVLNLEAALNSPLARPSRLCSTPIRQNVDCTEESPDQDLRGSPTSLYPCTQESGNEIAWDWHCATNKTNGSPSADRITKNNTILHYTPKRRQFFNKKRTAKSNSPLLNIPLKRKLVDLEVAESIGKFAAELKALADKIKTEQASGESKDNKNVERNVRDIVAGTSEELGISDIVTQKISFDIHEAKTLEVCYVTKDKTEVEKVDSSLDDLFDDSVDACMVQCSQEVEDKLKLGCEVARNSQSAMELCSEVESKKKTNSANANTSVTSRGVTLEDRNFREESCKDSKSKEQTNSRVSSSSKKFLSVNEISASQIPDDSFDDCVALCFNDEDDKDLLSKFVGDQKINEVSKMFNNGGTTAAAKFPTNKERPGENCSTKTNPKSIYNQNNEPFNNSSSFSSKPKQQSMGSVNAPTNNQNRKFFKEKSLSDSYYSNSVLGKAGKSNLTENYRTSISKSTSNHNLSLKFKGNEIHSKVSSTPDSNNIISTAGSKNNSSYISSNKQPSANNVSYSYVKSGKNNLKNPTAMESCDHYSTKLGEGEAKLEDLRTTAPSNSQQQRCTPEEIERKRSEARQRLEANKLKRQMSSNKSNVAISSQPIKRPTAVIKR